MIVRHQKVKASPPIRGENPYRERKAKVQERVKRSRQVEYCLTQCPHCDKPCNGSCAEFKAFISIKRGAESVRSV